METRNNSIEKVKGHLFELALAATLLIAIAIFEASSKVESNNQLASTSVDSYDIDLIPVTRMQDPVLPPPPPPEKTISDIIDVVDNENKVETTIVIDELDDDEKVDFSDIPLVEELKPEVVEDEPPIFIHVECMPEFPGGELALRKFIAENVKYPEMAKENSIFGTVYVRFVVDEAGKVVNIEVLRGVDPLLDKEAVRVVGSMPKWTPGKQLNKPAKVAMTIPIRFVLQ